MITPLGVRLAYCLAFIHVGTRKVYIAGMTRKPTHDWVALQARNMAMQLEDEGQSMTLLIRDGDGKFCKSFDSVFQSIGAQVKRLPYKSPNLNPYAESWVGTVKRECLNRFVCFGEDHLRYIIKEYVDYYNTVRPHSSLGRPIDYKPLVNIGAVHCQSRLGGLLRHYYRKAS